MGLSLVKISLIIHKHCLNDLLVEDDLFVMVCRVCLHVESGREKRCVQLRGGAAGADNREKTSGGVWRWSGHRWMDQQNEIGDLSAVGCSVGVGSGGSKAQWVSIDKCDLHVQYWDDVC